MESRVDPLPPLLPHPLALRPHILFWVVDDQGWANVGYHNPQHVITPHTDELATAGIKLERHYAAELCAPSRASLMTGRLPYHVLQEGTHVQRGFNMLPAKLKQVGYATHHVGKWHLGHLQPWMTPAARGFDSSLAILSAGADHFSQSSLKTHFGCVGVDLFDLDQPALGLNGTFTDLTFSCRAVSIVLQHNVSVPLFLYMALQVMHIPLQVPEAYSNLYDKHGYVQLYRVVNGMMSLADEALRNMTTALRAKNMWLRTFIVYLSDNGGGIQGGNNWPLRGTATVAIGVATIACPTTITTPLWAQPPLHHYHRFHCRRHRHRCHHYHRHRLLPKPPGFSPRMRWDPGGLVTFR